mmetsp:Transcript_22000/g.28480  ORF Transcript_22000/g.28480 Transcript_22000/m.28480 type:complete len:103 (+) Transcript_22000:1723-2031(+)
MIDQFDPPLGLLYSDTRNAIGSVVSSTLRASRPPPQRNRSDKLDICSFRRTEIKLLALKKGYSDCNKATKKDNGVDDAVQCLQYLPWFLVVQRKCFVLGVCK